MIGISHVRKPGCHDGRQRFLTKRYRPGSDPGKEFFEICCIATGHHGHAGNTDACCGRRSFANTTRPSRKSVHTVRNGLAKNGAAMP